MDLPTAKMRQEYVDEIKVIEANIKDIASGTAPQELYDYAQNKLDKLAKRFQYNEQIATARYKLYELQALLYYFQNRDDDALAFIQQAIEVKGGVYKRASKLIDQIQSAPSTLPAQSNLQVSEEHLTKAEKRKKLVGVNGWLAWYVVALFLGACISFYNLFSGGFGLSSSDIDNLNQYQSGLGNTVGTLVTYENMALVVYIALLVTGIVLILRRSRLAKGIAITGLAFGAAYTIADYAIASSIYNSAGLHQSVQSAMSQGANYAIRDTIVALIWIPYFLVSKRVKATLTK